MKAVEFFESTGSEIKKWFANQGVKVKVRNIRGKYIHVAPVEGDMPNKFRKMVINKVPFFQDANITDIDNIDYGNVRGHYIAISPDQWDIVMASEATRQLGDPSREVMVVKDGKVVVIDAEKEAEYLENGWELAESVVKEDGRPRGAPHIENERFWDLPDDSLRYIAKDAHEAMMANPEAKKAIHGPGNYADQVNDAITVLGWRKRHHDKKMAKVSVKRDISHTMTDVTPKGFGPADNLGEDTPSVVKKAGRRAAGSWSRPGSKKQKRAASKSSRQWDPNDYGDDADDADDAGELNPEGPYAIVWHGQTLEWYGDGDPAEGEGRYKAKGDAGNILAKNIPTYAIAQKLLSTTAKMSDVGDAGDHGKDGWLITNSSAPEIVPMSELGEHFYGYDPSSQEHGAKPEQDDHRRVMDLKTKMIDISQPEAGYVESTVRAWENYKNAPQKKIDEISGIEMNKSVAQKDLDYEEPAYKYEERPKIVGKLKNGMRVGITPGHNGITVVLYGKQKKAIPIGTITLFKHGKGYISSYSKITSKYQGQGIGLELYRFIIKKLGILLISDMQQTVGSQKVWVKLAQTPGIYVYGRRTAPGRKTQFFQVEPDSFGQLSGELEVYDQWENDHDEERLNQDLKEYWASIDELISAGKISPTKGKQMYDKERVKTNKEVIELKRAQQDTVLIATATKPPARGFIDLKAPQNEEKIIEKAPPGRENQVKALKGDKKVKNPYAVAWAGWGSDNNSKKEKG